MLWIHKDHFVVEKLVLNVCIKAFWYTNIIFYVAYTYTDKNKEIDLRKTWDELPGFEKKVYSTNKQRILADINSQESDDGSNR